MRPAIATILPLLVGSFLQAQEPAPAKLILLAETPAEKILDKYEEGDAIRVQGYVERTHINATGIHFVNFKDNSFECVTFARFLTAFPDAKGPADLYLEKWIEVSGPLENYRGNPQIKITSPDQVTVIDKPTPTEPDTPAPAEDDTADEPGIEEMAAEDKEDDSPESVVPALSTAATPDTPALEEVDGVPAIDWRKYFPSGLKK